MMSNTNSRLNQKLADRRQRELRQHVLAVVVRTEGLEAIDWLHEEDAAVSPDFVWRELSRIDASDRFSMKIDAQSDSVDEWFIDAVQGVCSDACVFLSIRGSAWLRVRHSATTSVLALWTNHQRGDVVLMDSQQTRLVYVSVEEDEYWACEVPVATLMKAK